MCTAATYQTKDFYFGRTLDYEFSYGDEIVVTPRKFPLDFCHMGKCDAHYGMIGMAHVADGYPLYYDAVNEKGVGMAGLNFVGNAVYQKVEEGTRKCGAVRVDSMGARTVCQSAGGQKTACKDEPGRNTLWRFSCCTAALDHCGCKWSDNAGMHEGRAAGL